jgi:hypothetical protein
MRGSGDAASPTLTAEALEEIIDVQQELLLDVLGDSPSAFPQVWVLYKVCLRVSLSVTRTDH